MDLKPINTLQFFHKVSALAKQAQMDVMEQFTRIDAIAEYNTRKVLSAFQKHQVQESYFAGTTGYGYDDVGRTSWTRSMRRFSAPRTLWCVSSSSTEPTPLPPPCMGH